MRRYLQLLALITLWSVISAHVYNCEPGTEPTVCRIWNMHYDEDIAAKHPASIPSVNFTSTVHTVQLLFERYYYNQHNQLMRYDSTLHGTVLRNPVVVQIQKTRLRYLFVPTNLLEGDFTDNVISVIVTDKALTYDVRYLDLADNSIREVSNLTALKQLQTLNLESNRIRMIDPDTFKGMANLTHLYLGYNHIAKFDFSILPKKLKVLWIARNDQHTINLEDVVLPQLRELNLETNSISSLDLVALFKAFPAMETILIAYNDFGKNKAKRITTELKRRNVSYYIGMERDGYVDCDYGGYRFEDLCLNESVNDWSLGKGALLLSIAKLVMGVFVLSIRWIWYQMRY
ncbi:uncharacterized protein LOC125766493 isoform X1 [Anopheles funestus]|uniref:uncharacterized protein LOC125766493 isoform X1 n=1 Tax=Anopheles funestus TaxID=62324 RepID=UPI0020C6DE52|nr:uncharacterized protein LOC125766493 isoform X1 [Anopheles funestus]